ncbi:Tat pathway signal protein [Tumidithrix helvetica PCC 7403]|uniref:Acg family FMN-binding oxidoreductase n=1 Tax=Tumidithrix helvetica TaxID=3457545 RepID=UPI003CB6F1E8
MLTRRQTIFALTALAGGSAAYVGASFHNAASRYNEAVRNTWRNSANNPPIGAFAIDRELVRYATLAASSHNTQCWKFRIEARSIDILPDLTRECPAVDPDRHHMFVSLGCATENLVQAAQAFGKHGAVSFDPAIADIVKVTLEPSKAVRSPLFEAIPTRQCTRAEYDGRKLSNDDLKSLESAGRGQGVDILLVTEKEKVEKILEYVVQGNTMQMSDRAFMDELEFWIRFGYDEVVNKGDGLFSASSGNPVLPRWLGMKLMNLFFSSNSENDKYAKHIRSSAGIAVFVSEHNDKQHWVEVGRCYERFALQATALGIKNAFLNQPVEVSTLRSQFASFLGIGDRRPDLVVRFGYGLETPRSLRRSLDEVIDCHSDAC